MPRVTLYNPLELDHEPAGIQNAGRIILLADALHQRSILGAPTPDVDYLLQSDRGQLNGDTTTKWFQEGPKAFDSAYDLLLLGRRTRKTQISLSHSACGVGLNQKACLQLRLQHI